MSARRANERVSVIILLCRKLGTESSPRRYAMLIIYIMLNKTPGEVELMQAADTNSAACADVAKRRAILGRKLVHRVVRAASLQRGLTGKVFLVVIADV